VTVPIFLIANPRSGTHLVRGFLRGSDRVEDLGEVFHPGVMRERPHGFFRFLAGRVASDADLAIPHREQRARLFDDYMAHLAGLASTSHLLIDAKYNNTHHFNGIWHDVDQVPSLIGLIRDRGYPVIHLVRRNLLHMYCSQILAYATNRWSVPSDKADQPPSDRKITIDPDTLVMALERIQTRINFFTWCLRDHAPIARLFYEDLLTDGKFNPDVHDELSDLIGVPLDLPLTPAYAKVSPPLGDFVSNYNDVIRALSGTRFLTMIS
jgi:hypothetical protein